MQRGRPSRGAEELLEVSTGARSGGELLCEELPVIADDREQVIEVVRHATSELTNCLELLRLP